MRPSIDSERVILVSGTDERILVMGVGNPLMRDDGVGPRVVELLRSTYRFPENVQVEDAGTMSFMILDLLRDIDRLIIVDAVKDTDTPAGTVFRMTPEEIAPNQIAHSLHDTKIIDVLQAADLMGNSPETIAIGVQIEAIEDWVLELSTPVEAAIPEAAALVIAELRSLGVEPELCDDADVPAQILEALRSYRPMPSPNEDQ
jgi:hydrogenase maturation protease